MLREMVVILMQLWVISGIIGDIIKDDNGKEGR